ncbi:MAG TPA: UDP-4-amino-4,6-dideoxy-N-acetyl-beta-L-altrosamine N-acetyltransferase [Thermoanaerobaculia bacterium]|nr:UDP-4-amino-4,6-dideoxy-N-acetyl-beta-L-altrosamine N-acetyltransferase [Thermoanaerobaculia bacterium]
MTGEPNGVALRPLALADILTVRRWRNDPDVARYMYSDHEIGEAEHARWFGQALDAPDRVYWIVELDGDPVGLANVYAITRPHRRAYWAFYLADPRVRGRGVGSYVELFVMRHAFVELGLEKLCCEVLAGNEAVIRMHQKFGFVLEGVLRRHVWKDAQPMDVVTLAILADEWRQRHG